MKKQITLNLIMVIGLISLFFVFPTSHVQSSSVHQENEKINADGYFCDNVGNCNGSFSIIFDPQGGSVSGSFYIQIPIISNTGDGSKVGIETFQGSLIGTFAGGDGGQVSGTLTNSSKNMHFTVVCDGCTDYTESRDGRPWQGNLYANGKGTGWILTSQFPWQINYSTESFFPAPIPIETQMTAPTLEVATASPLDLGDPTWVWSTTTTERMHSWLEIDQAIAEMLGQDSALIARDTNGNFYVVDNQGNRKPIPPEIVDALQVNDNFSLLSNRNLLENNPTIQALIAKEGTGVLDATDGTGDLAFYSPPDWLKQRQYMWLMTQCDQGVCSGYTKISMLKSSGYINMNARASSEHASVRGTINGGGDFIYEPGFLAVGSLLFSIFHPKQLSSYPPYLGVLVNDKSDGAEILKIQPGSPAEIAELQVGDLIANVDGIALDDQHTLLSVLSQFKGGDEIVLGIIRNGEIMAPNLTLAAWIPNVIETPFAWIMVSDKTELVYDIGLNGITAIYVISGSALVHEPETETQVEVPAGKALIVVPGEPVGEPFAVSDQDLNTWWKNSSVSDASSNATITAIQGKDFNPFPGVDGGTLYWGGWFIIAILYLIIFIVKLVKKP